MPLDGGTSTLSGGEQQRVALARSLAVEPDVLLLDEPTSALDDRSAQAVDRVVRSLVADGLTVVLVSHDLDRVVDLADTVLVLEQGRLVERGGPPRRPVPVMTTTPQIPDWLGVAASVLLVGIAVAVAMWARLGLTRELLWAAFRAFVQLLAVGALLTILFTRAGLLGALAWVAGMVVIAGFVAAGRSKELPKGRSTAWIAVGTGAATTVGVLLVLGVIEPVPPVVVPVGGMVVSGAMTATNLTMRRLADIAAQQRADIEARLALGLTADEAMAPHLRRAVKSALLPAIDSTKVVGLIALPGAMTGLILAGVEPIVGDPLPDRGHVHAARGRRRERDRGGAPHPRALFDDADRLHRVELRR